MKYILTTIILAFGLLPAFSQVRIDTGKYTDWHVDSHGNILINTSREILKFDNKGNIIAKWTPPATNNIIYIDASDNLRVLVFYPESYQISVLDRHLLEIADPLDLTISGIYDITKVCRSISGGIWAADMQTNTIYELQNNLRINLSFSFSNYGHVSEIKKMVAYDQQLWFLMTDSTWLVLDFFGQYLTRHYQKGLEKSQISKQIVHFIDEGDLYSYDIKLKESKVVASNVAAIKGCFIYTDLLYLFEDKFITIRNLNTDYTD